MFILGMGYAGLGMAGGRLSPPVGTFKYQDHKTAYFICYRQQKIHFWMYRDRYYRQYLGMKNVQCGIYRSPCRYYKQYTFGQYRNYLTAKRAQFRCQQ